METVEWHGVEFGPWLDDNSKMTVAIIGRHGGETAAKKESIEGLVTFHEDL